MKIHHIALTVNSLVESIKFYEETFGFNIIKEFEKKEISAKAVFMQLGDVSIELFEFPDTKQSCDDLTDLKTIGIRHFAFEVNDINRTVANLREQGLEVTDPQMGSSGHNFCNLTDPNGIRLELYEK